MHRKRIWFDITNTPHVNFLMPLIRYFEKDYELLITARNFSETALLLKKNDIDPLIVSEYKGKSRINKGMGLISRILKLFYKVSKFDISISLGGNYTAIVSRLRAKPSIIISDNDISYKTPAYKFGTYFIFPKYFSVDNLDTKYGVKPEQIFKFNGFKEDIYIADYSPDADFMKQLPFEEFITIRPENLKASYLPKNSTTIVPLLFEKFRDENILFLPRFNEEKIYAEAYNNIFIPDVPLNGLDVCYYTKAMLTGAGTFAREAALLGTPAVTFFPGKEYLTVDKIMIEKGWEFKSRSPNEIYKYVKHSKKNPSMHEQSKKVQKEVLKIITDIISRH
ncbi:hypothetical protein D1BOALGB6SA_3175 [Olavius sp. associated proteobacterium Delta 1]|nr:hypothetical protein D1BOALGB6SA_3175 [Olavius sp. associated proteobacterium Delta 1]